MGLTLPESIMVRRYRDDDRGVLLKSFVASSTKLCTILAGLTTINTSFACETGQNSE